MPIPVFCFFESRLFNPCLWDCVENITQLARTSFWLLLPLSWLYFLPVSNTTIVLTPLSPTPLSFSLLPCVAHSLRRQMPWLLILVLLHVRCVTLDKSLKPCSPLFLNISELGSNVPFYADSIVAFRNLQNRLSQETFSSHH